MRARLLRLTILLLGVFAIGCDDDPGPIVTPDGGADALVPDPDGGPPADEVPPFVVSSTPAHGAEVAADVAIEVVFSEAMDDATDVAITADGAEVTFDAPAWDGETLTITPSAPLPERASILVALGTGFADEAGNALSAPYELSFSIADETGPTITESTPADGATDVSSRLRSIEVTFSEPMNNSVGALAISAGTIGEPEWIDNDRFRADVSGLVNATGYTITFTGFVDSAGNAYDVTGSLGGDGALDFTTRADDEPPRVLDSNPAEGQINVRVRATPVIVVQFDEPMDTSVTDAALTGGSAATLSGTWNTEGTEIRFDLTGVLLDDRAHALDLSAFEDAAGNALDLETYLGDGHLDFITGADRSPPLVLFTNPLDGSSTESYRLESITIVFDKAMDTSVTTLSLEDITGSTSVERALTWNLSGTRAELDVAGFLRSGRTYRLELAGLLDAGGIPVEVTDPYLEDGAVEFTMSAPNGEACRDELTVAEATSSTDGVHVFELGFRQFRLNDGSASCDTSGIVADGVIRYTKTTPSLSDGGTLLRILADTNSPVTADGLNIEVFQGECDPTAVGAGTAREVCLFASRIWEQHLDVGPGDYYIWVSRDSGRFTGATVTIDEVDAPREGEGCLDPFDTSSANYTAPAAAGQPHRWVIEPNELLEGAAGMTSVDRGTPATCATDGYHGMDGVIRFAKESDTSVVRLMASETSDSSTDDALWDFEVLDECGPAGTSYVCAAEQDVRHNDLATTRELYFDGPAGDYYAWFSSSGPDMLYPGGALELTEIEPLEGSSCADARPLTISGAMTVPVAPDVLQRIRPPSCGGADAQFTWYRFTMPENAAVITADADADLALVDATTGDEISCDEGVAFGSAFVSAAGAELCVGIQSGSSVTSLEITPVDYTGVRGVVTDLNIDQPVSSSGTQRDMTSVSWMAATPTAIYMNTGGWGFLIAPRVGFPTLTRPDFNEADTFRDVRGNAAVAVGEAVFQLDSTTSLSDPRLYRFVDTLGAIPTGPVVWDTGTVWPADAFDAMTYDGTSLIVVNDYSTTGPVVATFRAFDPGMQGSPTELGTNPTLRDIAGIAADATYFYVTAKAGSSTATEGLYRVERASPANHELVALISISSSSAPVVLDPSGAYLYVRGDDGSIHVVADPGGASPLYLGIISRIGDSGDDAGMVWDSVENALIVLDSETDSDGRLVRLD